MLKSCRINGFVIFILSMAASFAQGPDTLWTRTYGGSLPDYGMAAKRTSDNGFIIVGWTDSFGAGNTDIYLVKTDANGDTMWTKTYGGTHEDGGNWVEQTSDGGYIIAGHTYSYGAGTFDVFLVRTDSVGQIQWTKTYGGYLYDQAWSIKETPEGGYIVAGFTGMFDPLYDFWLLRIDENGDTLWTRTYGGSLTEWCNSVYVTPDSGYILAGYTGYFNDYDVFLVKTDKAGNLQWTKTYGGNNEDFAWSALPTSDNGYIAIGWTESFGAGDTDIYLIKMDATGDTLWTKTYGGPNEDKAKCVQEIPGVGYIIVGSTFSYGAGGADVYLVRTDLNGNTLWATTYGATDWERGSYGERMPNGGYYIVGFTRSFGAGEADVYLLATTQDTIGVLENDARNVGMIRLEAYPNPFTHFTDIKYQITDNGQQNNRAVITLKIFDATGRLVRDLGQLSVIGYQPSVKWDGTDRVHRQLDNGVYFIVLTVGNTSHAKKLILVH